MKDTEEDPIRVCSVCEEKFAEVSDLERHLLRHNLYLCPSCERCFKYKRSYQNHRFLCEEGISKVTKPKPASTARKLYHLNNVSAKTHQNGGSHSQDAFKDASPHRAFKNNLQDGIDNRKDTDPKISHHPQGEINRGTVPQIKMEKPEVEPSKSDVSEVKTREPSPKMSEHQLPAKKRKTVTLQESDKTEVNSHPIIPQDPPLSQPMTINNNDHDLRTLALAAASVSPHSKAALESLAVETDSTTVCSSNRSSLSSPTSYKVKDKLQHRHRVTSTPEAETTRSSFTPQFMLPSAFVPPNGNPREPAFTWQGIEIQSETNIIARMDGYNPATEQHYVLYKCCVCSNAFPNLPLLISHLGVHGRGPKEHGCEKCGAVFKWRSQLEVHEQVHMVMDNMALSRASSLLSPPTTRPVSEIEDKPRDFSSKGNAVTNSKNNSLGYPSLPTSPFFPVFPTNNYSPSNSECGGHNGHNSTTKLTESVPVTTTDNYADSVTKLNRIQPSFQCNYCTKRFDRLFSMQRHERIHTGVKPCFCKQCGRGFSERRNLRHHVIRFHSDANQREGRSKKSKTRNPSHKLVSFLKKTAVRILNTMEQSKYGIPDPFQQGLMVDKPTEEEERVISASEQSQDVPLSLLVNKSRFNGVMVGRKYQEDNSEPETYKMEVEIDPDLMVTDKSNDDKMMTSSVEEDVTVVIPTEVTNGRESDSSLPESRNNQREVLRDPKRSLIGSRRKGRPFRYAPSQSSQNGSVNNEELLDINTDSRDSARTNPPTPPLTIVKEEIDPGMDDNSNFYCQFPFNLSGKENSEDSLQKYGFPGETSSQFKARLRGHGTFFSNYNPRLGVVNSPVTRSEACRPQIGPDGKYVYPCTYCFKTFCSTSDLNRHMDFHEDVRPFKCPYCNYYSRTNSQLKVHTMRHEGIKQFLCSLCNYNGVTQSDLNRHCKTRTHVLRARNCCLTCGVGFYTRTLLEEHLKLVNHCALDYGIIKKEREEAELADVREIWDSNPLTAENSNSNETNNNDYAFDSKNTESPPIPLYLKQATSSPVMV